MRTTKSQPEQFRCPRCGNDKLQVRGKNRRLFAWCLDGCLSTGPHATTPRAALRKFCEPTFLLAQLAVGKAAS